MSMEIAAQRVDSNAPLPRARTIFVAVFGLVMLYLFLSPNFQASDGMRATPLGSDFLQEYSGGYIWLNHRTELYEAQKFNAVQHDPAIVGFEWPASQYYPMVYPPFYYMLLSPLSQLPYNLAVWIWMLSSAFSIAACLWVWTSYYPAAKAHWGKCLLATLAFYPLLVCLNTAHKSTWLLLIFTSTYLLLYHRRPFAAGAVFGLVAFKPHLGLLIGIAMLFKRQWNFVAGCTATVSGLLLLSFVAGWDLCRAYFWQCLSMSDYTSTVGYQLSESHSLVGAVGLMMGTDSVMGDVVFRCAFVLVVTIFAAGLQGTFDLRSQRFALQFSMLVIATVLLSPHLYVYDLTILLLPIGLVAFELGHWKKRKEMSSDHRMLLFGCVCLYVLAGISGNLAAVVGVQMTIVLMLVILIVLAKQSIELRPNRSLEITGIGSAN